MHHRSGGSHGDDDEPMAEMNLIPLIDIALSPLSPELFRFQRHELGLSTERIGRSLTTFARRLLDPGAGPDGPGA